ncbi:MAG TPA: hypothetical protein VFN30_15160 [Chitinophagaceae bacterium]|nr:hypothetical protein [Chitinophagaceae bacterium]
MSKVILQGHFPEHGVSVKLSLFTFIEENVYVVYSPALDLYGYGNDEQEARHSFETTLHEYVKYTTNKKTVEQDLKKYGWRIDKKQKTLNSPDVSTLLQKNESFREIVNNRPFKKYDMNVQIPAFA